MAGPGCKYFSPRRRRRHTEAPIAQDAVDVVVAGKDDADLLVPEDGSLLTQGPIPGKGVGAEHQIAGVPVSEFQIARGFIHGLRFPHRLIQGVDVSIDDAAWSGHLNSRRPADPQW